MDMSDPGLAHPKAEPGVVTKLRRAKTDHQAERLCRAAVKKRDLGKCRIPGCINRSTALHHITYRSASKRLKWITGNVVSLCLDHHRLEHAGTITIRGDADVEIIVSGDVDLLKFRL